ncbi:MAG: acyl-phosphate glycerol-3-phosphate acyltransferase [Acidobacteriales bacterium]|nr:acyl-phosphate glycerol-3-phosphate acyltransferase [Terriglobales bacterium]
MAKTYFIVATIAYLLGSIPFGYILVRIFMKQDIRATGSGNIGATNVARSGAKGLAIATLLLDAAKGFVAVFLAASLAPAKPWLTAYWLLGNSNSSGVYTFYSPSNPLILSAGLAAFSAIVGHCFPVWLKFKGGKGVATGVGAFAALAPKAVMVAIVVFAVLMFLSRYVSLASVAASAVFPMATFWMYPDMRSAAMLTLIVASSALIIVKHHENIRRLMNGTESRFGAKSA